MRRILSSVAGVIAVAAIAIGVNIIADSRLADVQVDLTQQHLYTLAPGTRTILAGLKDPVTLRLFYSRRLGSTVPLYGGYADRVQELLRQYAALSHGRVRLEMLDPEPFSDTEDRALGFGLQGVPIDANGEQVYFGLAGTNLLDDQRVIPFLQPERERFLEYDLTRLVDELSNPARPVVGLMSSLPMLGDVRAMMAGGGTGKPWASVALLRQADLVKPVATDAQVIDPDIQVLLVAQPQNLPVPTQYAIDQFVMRGGRLMLLVDPRSEAEASTPGPDGEPPADVASDLPRLLDAWGIRFDPTLAVADPAGAWRVRAGADDRTQAVDYIAWFNIRDGIDRRDPATADLQQVTLAAAGALARKDGADIEFSPLLTSSAQSGLIPVGLLANPDPAKLLAEFKPQGGPRVVAARIRGHLKSAFAGPPDPAPGTTRPAAFPAHRAATEGAANMVVIADSDVMADRFWVRSADFFGQAEDTPFSDNGALIANLVDTLTGGDALIGLRSRGESLHPFVVVDDIQHAAELRFRQTEQTLQLHLAETQKQLDSLRQGGAPGVGAGAAPAAPAPPAMITPEQSAAIEAAQQEIVQTRQKLRGVQLDLRRDIGRLEGEVRAFDIVLVPAIVTVVALVIALLRRRRRARARA